MRKAAMAGLVLVGMVALVLAGYLAGLAGLAEVPAESQPTCAQDEVLLRTGEGVGCVHTEALESLAPWVGSWHQGQPRPRYGPAEA